jgi:xanthine dehydrogenase accessory factor
VHAGDARIGIARREIDQLANGHSMNSLEYYRKVVETLDSGREAYAALITASTGSTPQKPGAKMLIFADGSIFGTIGGGDVERKLIEDTLAKRPKEPWVIQYVLNEQLRTEDDPKMSCGGRVALLVEPLTNPNVLYIIGGGHCGVELSRLAALVGFSVTVYDFRPAWASRELHPLSSEVICAPYDEVEQHIRFSPGTFIVIMTHGHEHDEKVLRMCLPHESKYIGVIGSSRKSAMLFERLKSDGFSSETLSRVRCPIGLPILSHTPAEIAVSIVAQLIEVKNGSETASQEI